MHFCWRCWHWSFLSIWRTKRIAPSYSCPCWIWNPKPNPHMLTLIFFFFIMQEVPFFVAFLCVFSTNHFPFDVMVVSHTIAILFSIDLQQVMMILLVHTCCSARKELFQWSSHECRKRRLKEKLVGAFAKVDNSAVCLRRLTATVLG